MNTLNFFFEAPESLQDAIIRWLVACATQANNPLHECGLAFVRALFRAGALGGIQDIPVLDRNGILMDYNEPCEVNAVSIPQHQYQNIDVYFQAVVDGQMVSFIIEDKIDGQPGEDQLKRYLESVIDDNQYEDLIKPVYFKTGYVFNDERQDVINNNYSVFKAEDMQNFLVNHQNAIQQNQILSHYSEYLNDKIQTRTLALASWDLDQDYVQWEFMEQLRDVLIGAANQWQHFVPNALANFQHGWNDCLSRGKNRGGSPWTQYWFSEHLFWRLDAWKPLRLMIYLEDAGENYNGIQETYRDYFDEALNEEELHAGNAGIVGWGIERTIGSIDTVNLQGLTINEFLDHVMQVHISFLESIA